MGWLVGALTVLILFLTITIVVLVVCKGRFFGGKLPAMLETISPSEKKRNDALSKNQYSEPIKIQQMDPSLLSVRHILPNRSPYLHEKVQRPTSPKPKVYENTLKVP